MFNLCKYALQVRLILWLCKDALALSLMEILFHCYESQDSSMISAVELSENFEIICAVGS